MRSYLFSFPLVFLLMVSAAFASDGDSLTQRRQILSPCHPDATNVLDGMINTNFQLALKKANRKRKPSCQDLERALLDCLGDKKILGVSIPVGPLEKPIDSGLTKDYRINGQRVKIPSLAIPRAESIYRDAEFCESPGVVLGMASHFKLGGIVVGSDKLTHFFAQGYEYIEVYRECGLNAAVQHGIKTEKGKYGLSGNGIYSNGDLAANYSGLLFWLNLTHPQAGYFTKCKGKWVQSRRFSWRCHANAAWDEGINPPCGPAVQKAMPYVAALVRCNKIDHCPPLHHEKIPRIANHYPAWVLPKILHAKTLASVYSAPSIPVAVAEKRDADTAMSLK